MVREISTGKVDRYGTGYHDLSINECPHCGRETERVTLRMQGMGAKSKKCPYCSMGIVRRLIYKLRAN